MPHRRRSAALVASSALFAACALLALTSLGRAAPSADPANAAIDAAKQAMGGAAWDAIATWHETGKLSAGGLAGTYESWQDFATLHDASSFILGPASGSQGWDGRQAWTTDSTREVRIEEGGESVAQAIQDAYRSGYGFFFPDRLPSVREYAGKKQADGVECDVVKITARGAEPFEIWFDAKTHLITREVQLTGAQPHTFLMEDYARVDGLLVPRKIIDRVGNDPRFDTVTMTGTVALVAAQAPSRYAPPPPPPNSAQWPAGRDSVAIPFRLLNNHIYVEASIDGKPPRAFVFDTGATDVLDTGAAKRLGIAVEGALPSGGFGDKIEAAGLAKVKSVSLGGLTLTDQVFGTENFAAWIAVEGADLDGILGYEFAKRAVLTIDYAKRLMTFTKQDAFHPPAGVTGIPFTFDEHVPMVTGKLDGAGGEFEVDTGSRGALTLMAPFAAAHGLVAKYHADHSVTVGYGIGGPSKALLARAGHLTIGGVTIEAPVAEIVTDKGGVAESARTAGNIGGDLLKRFTLTLDYAHRTLWLEPNALAAQPEPFDRSGLWIARAPDGGIAVADVATGSAAAAAGLATGDEITSVGGRSAKDIALYDLREDFKSAGGREFSLRVKSKGGGERTVALVLRDQV